MKKVIAHFWLYASTRPELGDQDLAKRGMILGLGQAYEDGRKVSKRGTLHRLIRRAKGS